MKNWIFCVKVNFGDLQRSYYACQGHELRYLPRETHILLTCFGILNFHQKMASESWFENGPFILGLRKNFMRQNFSKSIESFFGYKFSGERPIDMV